MVASPVAEALGPTGLSGRGTWTQPLQLLGSQSTGSTVGHVGFSQARDQTCVSRTNRRILYH